MLNNELTGWCICTINWSEFSWIIILCRKLSTAREMGKDYDTLISKRWILEKLFKKVGTVSKNTLLMDYRAKDLTVWSLASEINRNFST